MLSALLDLFFLIFKERQSSPFDVCDWLHTHTHTSTHATSLMHVKSSMCHFCLWRLCCGTLEQRNQRRAKTLNLIVDHFSLTFVNLSLAWMLYSYIWLQNNEKFLFWSECCNQFGIYQPSYVSLLEPQENNLSNPEAYIQNPVKYLRRSALQK